MSESRTAPSASWPGRRQAWYTLTIVTIAYVFAILDRIAISLFIEPIKQDLQLSDTQIGLLQGLAFSLLYTAFSFPMGYWADRKNRVHLFTGCIIVWSLGAIGCGLAGSFLGLFVARLVLGAGESGILPLANSIISDNFEPKTRGRAFSVFVFGTTIGTAASYFLGGVALEAAGGLAREPGGMTDWQLAFILIGVPGLLVAPLLYFTVPEPVRRERTASGTAGPTISSRELLHHLSKYWLAYTAIIGSAVLNGAMVAAQTFWYPSLFIRVYDWSPGEFGKVYAAWTLPNGIVAMLTVGWVLSRLARSGRHDGPVVVLMIQLVVWGVFGVLKSMAPTAFWSLAFNVATGLTGIWSMTAAMTALSAITPNQLRGQVTAIYAISTALISYSLGTAIVGLLTDHVFPGNDGIAPSLATVYGFCGGVGAAILWIGRRSYEDAATAVSGGQQPG